MSIRYFEKLTKPTTQQFRRVVIEPKSLITQFGEIGTEGEIVETTFETVEACATAADRAVASYVSMGYREILPGAEVNNSASPRLTLQLSPIHSFCIFVTGKTVTCCAQKADHYAIETWSTQTGELVQAEDYRLEGTGWRTNFNRNSVLIACKLIGEHYPQQQSDTALVWHGWREQRHKPTCEIACTGFDVQQMVAYGGAIVGHDGKQTVQVWNSSTGEILGQFETPSTVRCTTIEGDWIAAGGGSNQQGWVSIWNWRTGIHRCTLTVDQEADNSVTSIASNNDCRILVVSLRKANLQVWQIDETSGVLLRTLYSYHSTFKPIRFDPGGQSVCTIDGANNGFGNIQRWHIWTGNPIQQLTNVQSPVDFAITPFDQTQILTRSAGSGYVCVWDLPEIIHPARRQGLPKLPHLAEELLRVAEMVRSPQVNSFIKQCCSRYFDRAPSEYVYMQDFVLWAQKRGVLFSLEAVRRSPLWSALANAISTKRISDDIESRKYRDAAH